MKHYANWWARKINPGAACAAHALPNPQSLLTRPVEPVRASAASPPRTRPPPGKPFGLSAGRGNAHGSRCDPWTLNAGFVSSSIQMNGGSPALPARRPHRFAALHSGGSQQAKKDKRLLYPSVCFNL